MHDLAGPLIIIAVFAWLAVNDWLENRTAAARQQADIEAQKLALESRKLEFEGHKLLLEKCQSTEEVNQFLATDAGKMFVERVKVGVPAPAMRTNSLAGIIALIVFGILFSGLGLAFLLLAKFTSYSSMIIPAFLLLIPGLGLFIGAAVSYHLKKKWGLLERAPAASV